MNERERIVNRKISICILSFIGVLLLLYSISVFWQKEEETPLELSRAGIQEDTEAVEQAVPSNKTEIPFVYIMYVVDGMLTVYERDGTTVYLDTGIAAEYLPQEIKDRLIGGIRFSNEKELYDFLESYSS